MDKTAGIAVALHQAGPIPLAAEFGCAPGELAVLVGPSGSGKSTILRCIAGLYRARRGRVLCGGVVWQDSDAGIAPLPPQRRSVGLVFQHYALFPHLTAAGNVAAALGHLPRSRRAERARELLALVHLDGLGDRRPAELSGGQQQRVAVARALARDPAVLLLDEPFSAVDQVTRRRLHRELAQLRERVRMPIVLVTHDLEEAVALADRMIVLHHGRTLQSGPPSEVLRRPRDAEVARLVDQRNVFAGEIAAHRHDLGRTLIRWRGHLIESPLRPEFAIGQRVAWLIPPAGIVLHRRDRPSRGEYENPVHGVVAESVVLNDTAQVEMRLRDHPNEPLWFGIPAHVASRNRVARGESVAVSLLAKEIHVMPVEPRPMPPVGQSAAAQPEGPRCASS
jgi:molybdate transport system ATP-binding protein